MKCRSCSFAVAADAADAKAKAILWFPSSFGRAALLSTPQQQQQLGLHSRRKKKGERRKENPSPKNLTRSDKRRTGESKEEKTKKKTSTLRHTHTEGDKEGTDGRGRENGRTNGHLTSKH